MSGRFSTKGNLHLSSARKKNKGGYNLSLWRKGQQEILNQTSSTNSISQTQELVEPTEECSNLSNKLSGRRIVNLKYFVKELQQLNDHSPIGCNFSHMEIISEKRRGLKSAIKFKCKMCNFEKTVWTDSTQSNHMSVNTSAAAGIMSIGGGFSNMEEFFAALDIPSMSVATFSKEHEKLCEEWEATALNEMIEAGKEEKKLAIERGDVDSEGIPLLTVVVDGSWAKRSYRTNYASLSGVAAIVGYETKKVLYVGVKNKYCCTCARASQKNIKVAKHNCFKNWSGSSSSMEAGIIADGFEESIKMHGVKYARFIADGDSNVYKKILDRRPYDSLTVEKIECKNHLLRNMCNKLKDIARNSKNGHITLRKILGDKILRIRLALAASIRHHKKSDISQSEKLKKIREDILNIPMHIFGDHQKCASYFCAGDSKEKNYISPLKASGLLHKILQVLGNMADNAKSLLFNASNNPVELFNNIIAKFVGGKRINYCLRRSYQSRCYAAVVSHNSKSPLYTLHKNMCNKSPGNICKIWQKRKTLKRTKAQTNKIKKRRRLFCSNDKTIDTNYGPRSQKPDLNAQDFIYKKEKFLKDLKVTEEEFQNIQRETELQRLSPLWMEERRKRLTASNFGTVCNRLAYTKCDNLVKSILYNHNFDNESLRYGRKHERDAVEEIKKLNISVNPCGLFIDRELPFLAATPDGLIDEDGIVEIKCPSSCINMTPDDAIFCRKVTFWSVDKRQKKITGINMKHPYYFQIQGQLHITNRKYCQFALWTPYGMKTERIQRDDEFWKKNMVEKLHSFYHDCLLPEIIDPRYVRSMPIRNPDYIIEAQKRREEKKLNPKM